LAYNSILNIGSATAAFLWQVYKFNVPTFGPGVVFDVDVSIRTEQIRFFAESLKTEKLKSYVPLFVQEAEVGRNAALH
jgi:hypothetical protein